MKQPPFKRLGDWLRWQESLNPQEIDLGLTRVREVAGRLGLLESDAATITVAGTNGKGSSVAMLVSAYQSAGYRVGSYTSPHLRRYNERIQIDGVMRSDEDICAAFKAVEQARHDVQLTYFEFGTLAALYCFTQSEVDIQVLEVGLGGRLDAVNIIDAQLALVTNIGMDHTDWLGDSREAIGIEKAGVFRADQLAVYNDPAPVASVQEVASNLGCDLRTLEQDYQFSIQGDRWIWTCGEKQLTDLPCRNAAAHQVQNAAGVLTALYSLGLQLPLELADVAPELLGFLPDGRSQSRQLEVGGIPVEVILDVAHNDEAVTCLARQLSSAPAQGKTYAVFAALQDKPIESMAKRIRPHIDEWLVVNLHVPRACSNNVLAERLNVASVKALKFEDMRAAWKMLATVIKAEDRVVVFGSFHTVEAALAIIEDE